MGGVSLRGRGEHTAVGGQLEGEGEYTASAVGSQLEGEGENTASAVGSQQEGEGDHIGSAVGGQLEGPGSSTKHPGMHPKGMILAHSTLIQHFIVEFFVLSGVEEYQLNRRSKWLLQGRKVKACLQVTKLPINTALHYSPAYIFGENV